MTFLRLSVCMRNFILWNRGDNAGSKHRPQGGPKMLPEKLPVHLQPSVFGPAFLKKNGRFF